MDLLQMIEENTASMKRITDYLEQQDALFEKNLEAGRKLEAALNEFDKRLEAFTL